MAINDKKKEIAISVIVPTFNLEKYIKECVDSVLNQSFKNFEIILVDDGSDDDTKKIIKYYIEHEEKTDIILLENEENRGAGYSRNRGLNIARGKYLLFLDGDDMLEHNALEKLYSVGEKSDADIVIYNYYFLDDHTHVSTKCHSPVDMLVENEKSFVSSDVGDYIFQYFREIAWDKLFRREFIQESNIRFQCQSNANDQFFVYAAMLKAQRMVKIIDYLLRYRINRRNQLSTSGNISRNPLCIFDAVRATMNDMVEHGFYHLYKRSYHIYVIERLIFSMEKVDSTEAEKLLVFYQREGFQELELNECHMDCFGVPYFFAVYKKLLCMDSIEQLEDIRKWKLWDDERKVEKLFYELILENNIVLWGVGINGEKFLDKSCKYKLDIRCVVDMDENKTGKGIYGYKIKYYGDIEDGDLIIVLNPNHIPVISHLMSLQKKKLEILDVRAYLCLDLTYEQAKVEVL